MKTIPVPCVTTIDRCYEPVQESTQVKPSKVTKEVIKKITKQTR